MLISKFKRTKKKFIGTNKRTKKQFLEHQIFLQIIKTLKWRKISRIERAACKLIFQEDLKNTKKIMEINKILMSSMIPTTANTSRKSHTSKSKLLKMFNTPIQIMYYFKVFHNCDQ
jgi:hypothetical protein